MIRTLLVGIARALFIAATAAAVIAALLVYASFRTLKAAFGKQHQPELRDASFAILGDLVQLSTALKARIPS